jgi:molybdopterin-biosynthesis enzyme MoeA-like protein
MPTADSSASKVTAALLVIGSKILSGRTKEQNIGYIAEYLTAVGVDLKEVRVVGDEEKAIVDALNALRHRCTYVFTTGGIGPTHGDITADCVGKAFGVSIDSDPRALAILHEWVETTGAEMTEARLRLTRIPKGADLILNKVSGTPGFWIGNVIVMAGVPSIMQAMLDEVAPKLKIGVRMRPCALILCQPIFRITRESLTLRLGRRRIGTSKWSNTSAVEIRSTPSCPTRPFSLRRAGSQGS